jgi:type I restriction enzyme, S subunit
MTDLMGLEGIPSDWDVVRFDALFDVQQGKQVSKKNRVGTNQRPFLRTRNLYWGHFDLAELDQMHFTAAEEKKLALQHGDLLICEGGDIGRTAIWRGEVEGCYYQNHLHRARARDKSVILPEYALFWLWYAFEIGELYFGRGNITTIPNLSQSKLRELPVALPPPQQQHHIASLLQLIQTGAAQERERLGVLDELFGRTITDLMTGAARTRGSETVEAGRTRNK